MKKSNTRKLTLAPESVRNLTAARLIVVAGGIPDTTNFVTACPTLHSHCGCVPG